jgi:hypothetical protein
MTTDAKWRALRQWLREEECAGAALDKMSPGDGWHRWARCAHTTLAEMSRLSRQPKKGKKR